MVPFSVDILLLILKSFDEIEILPVLFTTVLSRLKAFNDDILTSPEFVLFTVPAILRFWALFVFLIEIPSVASTLDVFFNVKLPFLFSIAMLPAEVSIFDAISALTPLVVILISPIAFVILPFIEVVPLETIIAVSPWLFIIAASCL